MQLKYAFLSATHRKWNFVFLWPFTFHFPKKTGNQEWKWEGKRIAVFVQKIIRQLSSSPICDRQIFRLIFSQALTLESIFKKLSEQIVIPPPTP